MSRASLAPTVCKAGGKYLVWASDGRPGFSANINDNLIVMPGITDLRGVLYKHRKHLDKFPEMSLPLEFVKLQYDSEDNVSERPKGESR